MAKELIMKFKLWLENQEQLDIRNDPYVIDIMQANKKYHDYSPEEYENTAKFFAIRMKDIPPNSQNLHNYGIDPNHVVMARVTNPREFDSGNQIERYWTHNPQWTVTQMLGSERADKKSQLIFTNLATLMKKGQVHPDPSDASDDQSAYLVTGNPKFNDHELIGKTQTFNPHGKTHPSPIAWSDEEYEKKLKPETGPDNKFPPPPQEFKL